MSVASTPARTSLGCIVVTLTTVLLTACTHRPPDLGTPQHQLIVAARKGDSESVRRLLKSGVSIETREPQQGPTVLAIAADYGHADTVNLFIAQGANIVAAGLDGDGATIEAARVGNLAKLTLLLTRGANVRLRNEALLETAGFSIASVPTPVAMPGVGEKPADYPSSDTVPFPSLDQV